MAKKKGKESIRGVLSEKRAYDAAKEAGDTAGMDAAQTAAEEHYRVLEESSDPKDREAASALHAADVGEAENILHRYATEGRTAIRDYMGEALGKEGLSFEEKDLTYDPKSGEVRYKGVSMGVPDYVSKDGVSYADRKRIDDFIQSEFGDSLKSDGYYKDAHSREALTDSKSRSDFLASLTDGSFRRTVGQDIMDHYLYDGRLAAEDEVADAAANSAGNLDSFGAANAARQMLAYRAAGDEAVQKEIDTILGGYRTAAEDEYRYVTGYDSMIRGSEESRRESLAPEAETSGVLPAAFYTDPARNPYLNADGTAKEEIPDYAARMNEVRGSLADDSLTAAEKDRLWMDYNYLNAARNAKMEASSVAMEAGKNNPYTYHSVATESAREAEAEDAMERYGIEVGRDLTREGYDADILGSLIGAYSNERIADKELEGKYYDTDMNAYLALREMGLPATPPARKKSTLTDIADAPEEPVSNEERAAGESIARIIKEEGVTPAEAADRAFREGIAADGIRQYLLRHYGTDWQPK